MIDWEKIIERYYERLSYLVEWVNFPGDRFFLLAWKGSRLRVVFVDLENDIGRVSADEAKERFLVLLVYLRKQRQWERVFKGRDVSFQWLTLESLSASDKQVLAQAGVEPFSLLKFEGRNDGCED